MKQRTIVLIHTNFKTGGEYRKFLKEIRRYNDKKVTNRGLPENDFLIVYGKGISKELLSSINTRLLEIESEFKESFREWILKKANKEKKEEHKKYWLKYLKINNDIFKL